MSWTEVDRRRQATTQHFPEETEENSEKPQDSLCPEI
jgi:hypothetical protein